MNPGHRDFQIGLHSSLIRDSQEPFGLNARRPVSLISETLAARANIKTTKPAVSGPESASYTLLRCRDLDPVT
jgi:hypothetical protein